MKYIFYSLIFAFIFTSCDESYDYIKVEEQKRTRELEREVDIVCESSDCELINQYIENRKSLIILRPAERAKWESEIKRFKARLTYIKAHPMNKSTLCEIKD